MQKNILLKENFSFKDFRMKSILVDMFLLNLILKQLSISEILL